MIRVNEKKLKRFRLAFNTTRSRSTNAVETSFSDSHSIYSRLRSKRKSTKSSTAHFERGGTSPNVISTLPCLKRRLIIHTDHTIHDTIRINSVNQPFNSNRTPYLIDYLTNSGQQKFESRPRFTNNEPIYFDFREIRDIIQAPSAILTSDIHPPVITKLTKMSIEDWPQRVDEFLNLAKELYKQRVLEKIKPVFKKYATTHLTSLSQNHCSSRINS